MMDPSMVKMATEMMGKMTPEQVREIVFELLLQEGLIVSESPNALFSNLQRRRNVPHICAINRFRAKD